MSGLDPRHLRPARLTVPALIFAAIIGLAGSLCAAAPSRAISRAVVTVPAVLADGAASTRNVARRLLALCKASPATFDKRLEAAGGAWRLLETPVAAHLVMLLPQTASEAETLLGELVSTIASVPGQAAPASESISFQERLFGAAIGQYRETESAPALWIDGPLASAQTRLGAFFTGTASETPASKAAPESGVLIHPNGVPAVARLLTWEPSSPSAHFTARHLGETFTSLPNLPQGATAFDLWDLPTRTFLLLLATGSIDELERREQIIDSFIRDKCASSSVDPRWAGFASASLELVALDRRDLAKSALLSAVASRNHWNIQSPLQLSNLRPTSIRALTVLPDASWAGLFQENGPSLRLITAAIPAGTGSANIVDAVLLIRPVPAHAAATTEAVRRLLDEDGIPSAQKLAESPAELQISMSLPLNEFSGALTTIRSRLPAFFLANSATPAGTITLAVVGNGIPPYRIIGRVHEAWPMDPQSLQPARQPLSAELMKTLLDLPAAGSQELRGRWTLCAASQNTLAAFLARLADAGVSLRSLDEIDRLLAHP